MMARVGRSSRLGADCSVVQSWANLRFQGDCTGTCLCDVCAKMCWHLEDFCIAHQHTRLSQEDLTYIAQKWCKIIIASLPSVMTVLKKKTHKNQTSNKLCISFYGISKAKTVKQWDLSVWILLTIIDAAGFLWLQWERCSQLLLSTWN